MTVMDWRLAHEYVQKILEAMLNWGHSMNSECRDDIWVLLQAFWLKKV